jgi:hypothetical protein
MAYLRRLCRGVFQQPAALQEPVSKLGGPNPKLRIALISTCRPSLLIEQMAEGHRRAVRVAGGVEVPGQRRNVARMWREMFVTPRYGGCEETSSRRQRTAVMSASGVSHARQALGKVEDNSMAAPLLVTG